MAPNAKKVNALAYFFVGNDKIKPTDTVYMQPSGGDKNYYIGRVEKIEEWAEDGEMVRVSWFYRPEEALGGRKSFHGEKELFESNHTDWVSAHAIHGLCRVLTLKAYERLEAILELDFFTRFMYKAQQKVFKPDRVPVYCTCEMPYNPDQKMVMCESCKDWFHLSCLAPKHDGTPIEPEDITALPIFLCDECTAAQLQKQRQQQQPPPAGAYAAAAEGPPTSSDESAEAEAEAKRKGKRPMGEYFAEQYAEANAADPVAKRPR